MNVSLFLQSKGGNRSWHPTKDNQSNIRVSWTMLLILFQLFINLIAGAQQLTSVSGTVTDVKGEKLIGVSVKVKGTNRGGSTDSNGRYSLNAVDANSTLVFTYVGFSTLEVPVNGRSRVDVKLQDQTTELSQVVVVGYGTQQKKDLTGAVSVVKSADIQKRQATTVAEAMQGLASGVNIRGGGQPGSEAQIQIRGLKNLSNTNPLYVIDGMITTANRDFNPNDIESLQILKDASAAAIYGSRAANGVIIITTKQGKEGPMKVDFSGKSSIQTIPRYDLAGTEEFSRLNFMAYDNAGATRQNLNTEINTNWQDEAFRTGNIQDYNLSFSGGSKNGGYMVSTNYYGNKGTVIDTKFDRLSFRVNTRGSKGIFSIGENLAISNAKADEMSGNPIIDVVRLLPTIPVFDPANPGGYGYGSESRARTFGTNPVAIADLEDRTNENLRIRGNIWSELGILKSLKYRLNVGYETSNDHYNYLRKKGNWTLNQPADPTIVNENRAGSSNALIENTLTFNKQFQKHKVTLLAGQTYQNQKYQQIWGTKRNLVPNSNGSYYTQLDQGNEPQTGGFIQKAILLSYLGRAEYSFADKYLLNAVFRRDGTSRLNEKNQWGNFPSFSAAWRLSEEPFFKNSLVNDLKLRASWGKLGSSNIGYWDYLATINNFSTIAMGQDQHIEAGATQVKLVNNDLRWETLAQTNIGLDASLLQNRFSFSAEYFIADTKDVLTGMPIALTTGNDGGNPLVNAASLKNSGFEFSGTYRQHKKDLDFSVTANLTTLKNKVTNLGYGRSKIFVGNTVTELGQPIGMWYVLETDGLFQTPEEVNDYKNEQGKIIQPNAKPGDIRFKDNNGDGQITNADKSVVAKSNPDYQLGLNFNVSFKRVSFNMDWFGAFGSTIFNGPRSVTDRFDDNSNYRAGIQPWTPENPDTSVPRAYYGSTLNSRGDTDRWLEDGSFLRLKYVSLAYALPASTIKRVGLANASISLSAQNILTFTKYTGLDPEFSNGSIYEKGYDFGAFPNVRMISLGLQLGF
ncbi:SusC/RagA family TonB-linked outer membrane protein [Desertivirga arenae]|uniref:SusC/RagA family TonB-linked outer membrane protein n=1 Tax=Desertivirga arenae TaxID=2810309 RepID=UPI001F606BE0|nr:TonB-dependent receptor [Pedobacter sp. SYSU D00823]